MSKFISKGLPRELLTFADLGELLKARYVPGTGAEEREGPREIGGHTQTLSYQKVNKELADSCRLLITADAVTTPPTPLRSNAGESACMLPKGLHSVMQGSRVAQTHGECCSVPHGTSCTISRAQRRFTNRYNACRYEKISQKHSGSAKFQPSNR